MKIKVKLTLGVGLLFLLIILLSVLSTVYINELSKDTQNILVANYKSLDYSRKMTAILDGDLTNPKNINQFSNNLKKQQQNVTEIGEQELTDQITLDFNELKKNPKDKLILLTLRKDLSAIMLLNMQAIERKSNIATQNAKTAKWSIALVGTFCLLIAFALLINLPGNIANPIKKLTESIRQIAAKKYSERVNFESHNEYGDLAKSFNTMAEKLEEYNNSSLAKLMMEKKRIETLINNMHDPVIGLDENLKVIFVNQKAINIIGLQENKLVDHLAQELAIKNDFVRLLIQDIVKEEKLRKTEKIKPVKIYADGKESYFEKEMLHISILPTGEKEKMLIGHVIILRNVTEYKELDFAKTNFIATVSHEFKTPISSIKLSLQLLENEQIGQLNIEQKNLVDSIKDDANRLLKITSEILNMAQVESGNIQLSILPCDPKEILTYALNATKTQADQKKIKLEAICSDNLHKVIADKEKTAWILTNLITNAIRYSYDNSSIFVSIFEENKKIFFSVKDTGQGIELKYLDKIFDRYFRIPGEKKEGTGLGLAISKEFIEAQGGQIAVESEFGAGSTFTIALKSIE